MIDHDFSRHSHLLNAKTRMLGSIQNDRGVELSDIDYLEIEIKEAKQARRANSMPFLGIALVILVFSAAGNTALTQFFGSAAGLGFLIVAYLIVRKYTQRLRSLRGKLAILTASTESDSSK